MAEVITIDDRVPETCFRSPIVKRCKLPSPVQYLDMEEIAARKDVFNAELHRLRLYFKELSDRSVTTFDLSQCEFGSNLNSVVALLIEESNKPLSELVNDVYEKVNSMGPNVGVTMAAVKSSVLLGQRTPYGVPNVDVDPLEDKTESCLWCWESRDMKDMKFLPLSVRGALIIRRTGRKKIQERIIALSEMIRILELSGSSISKPDYMKALQKLSLVLSDHDIRLLVGRMMQKICAEKPEKVVKQEVKDLIKELEKSKRKEMEEEKLKRRREKEEFEMRKLQKRQQEEEDKEQRRKDKENVEKKKQLGLKKSVSIMERFVIRDTVKPTWEHHQSPLKESISISFTNRVKNLPKPVTKIMDDDLQQFGDINIEELCKSQFNLWRSLGQHVRANRKCHPWGIRQKPKNQLIKELQLASNKKPADNEFAMEKLVDGAEDVNELSGKSPTNNDFIDIQKRKQNWQLLQFDKSFRPAFYGIWPKKSIIIRPRNPLEKHPELDYDYDSDEEWEEEDPGEDLSDCDKEDDELDEECLKPDDEDESEDGFFVPDGYLSENERMNIDDEESDPLGERIKNSSSEQQPESEELVLRFQRLKYVYNMTEHHLRKNQPLIISKLYPQKDPFLDSENLNGISKTEQIFLLSSSWIPFPGGPTLEDDVQEIPSLGSQGCTTPVPNASAISESDLPQIVSCIQSCGQGISKVVESLQEKFPSCPKTQLRNKVREISTYVDNHWQVKKDILDKLGIVSASPEKGGGGGGKKTIAAFFPKRVPLPP